jgi:alkylation response protein AidB-like acyl-CoA dehydrogenase
VDFAFSDEQQMLRASARDWLADRYPLDRVGAISDGELGFDPDAWAELTKLGWLDESLTVTDLAVLCEEAGWGLLPAPFVTTVALAAPFVGSAERPASVVHDGLAPDGAAVELLVAGDRVVETSACTLTPLDSVDRLRRYAQVQLPSGQGQAVTTTTDAELRSGALLACEAVGVTQRALDLVVDYVKQREQFGRVIGSYQAIAHRVADVYVQLELARSLAYWAAWAVEAGDPQAAVAVAAARSTASEAAVFGCEAAIQAHGGIGFTWEHPLHRFYKRAQWISSWHGSPTTQRAQVAAAVLDD